MSEYCFDINASFDLWFAVCFCSFAHQSEFDSKYTYEISDADVLVLVYKLRA